jgi:lipoprotein-releasing system ATP-binding protein
LGILGWLRLNKKEGRLPASKAADDGNIIVIKDLMKVYKGGVDVVALDNINLKIKQGEFLAIVGPSGSGKSTLLNMIGLLDTPTSGQISLKGIDVTKITPNDRAKLRNKELGFVFQYHHLIPEFTAVENVMMPMLIAGENKKEALNRAKALLDDVGLGDRLNNKPNQLSGGQNQRVAVARALVNQPSVIIGDELTGNLDTKSSNRIYELLRDLNRKMNQTFILVTHDMVMAEKTDRILRIVDGKIVCELKRDGDKFVSDEICAVPEG